MATYKLKAGAHVVRGEPLLDEDGREVGRRPPRTFRAGDTIESDEDLVARWGPERVELVGGDARQAAESREQSRRIRELEAELAKLKAEQAGPHQPGMPTADNLANSPAVFPGGQISTGLPDGLDGASEEKLRRIAEDEEIDLEGVEGRDAVLRAVREGRQGVQRQQKEQQSEQQPAQRKAPPPQAPKVPAATPGGGGGQQKK